MKLFGYEHEVVGYVYILAMKEKNLGLERLVFFSDAIVAIDITILVFNLKVTGDDGSNFSVAILAEAWPKFIAFFLSFFSIASF